MNNRIKEELSHRKISWTEILTIPRFPYKIFVPRNSHLYSHGWDNIIEAIKRLLPEFSDNLIAETFKKPLPKWIRLNLPLPQEINLDNKLIETNDNSPIFYANRAINWKKWVYRRWRSRLVLNWEPKKATHLFIAMLRYTRPKSWEIVYKIITSFPSWWNFSPPEPWDKRRIEELWLDMDEVVKFWNNHALIVSTDEPWYVVQEDTVFFPKHYSESIIKILEWSWKL